MVAARGYEGGLGTKALSQLKTKHSAIEGQGSIQVGNFQMHVPDADTWIDCSSHSLKWMAIGWERALVPARGYFGNARSSAAFHDDGVVGVVDCRADVARDEVEHGSERRRRRVAWNLYRKMLFARLERYEGGLSEHGAVRHAAVD